MPYLALASFGDHTQNDKTFLKDICKMPVVDAEETISALRNYAVKKPIFLYFFDPACPFSCSVFRYIASIYQCYSKNIIFIGVYKMSPGQYEGPFSQGVFSSFPVIFDPDETLVKKMNVLRSSTVQMYDKNFHCVKKWEYWSQCSLMELSRIMACISGLDSYIIKGSEVLKIPKIGRIYSSFLF